MATTVVFLLIMAALIAIWVARPTGPSFSFSARGDHDRQRELDELRTLVDYRDDPRRR